MSRLTQLGYAFLISSFCAVVVAQNDSVLGEPPWQQASLWPDRIIQNLSSAPANEIAINWRTDSNVASTIAQIAPATADARFDAMAATVVARTEPVYLNTAMVDGVAMAAPDNFGLGVVHYHSAVFDGLQPDTLYAYRVRGAEGAWSEWIQTRTAPATGPVKFAYFGGAQNGILSHWSRVVRAAFSKAPDARFFLHAGDLVNRAARDFEWAEWFRAGSIAHSSIPSVVVVGNHEVQPYGFEGQRSERVLSHLWRPQFSLPEDATLPASLQETVYDIRYNQDIHLFVLNSLSQENEAQANWLDRKLAASDARWKFVTFHYPIFSSAGSRDSAVRRDLLLPILQKHSVDLVLQGHDHTYARGAIGQAPQRLALGQDTEVDVMFVNSVSGAKMYELKPDGWDSYAEHGVVLQKAAENTQFYQIISVDGARLTYEAYTADDQLYDYFEMVKGSTGSKSLSVGSRQTLNARRFSNTADYGDAPPL